MTNQEFQRVKQLLKSNDGEMKELGQQLFVSLNGSYVEYKAIWPNTIWSEDTFNIVRKNLRKKYKTNTA